MLLTDLFVILVLVALNGFFVSVEFAAVAARRSRVSLLAESGSRSARIVQTWLENPAARDRLIAAAQLGITIVSLALGAAGENMFEALLAPYFDGLALPRGWEALAPALAATPLAVSLVLVTAVHVVLGEQVPKVAALHSPERFAVLAARPMHAFATVFKWFIDLLDWATRHILRVIGITMVGEHSMLYSVEELKHIVAESEEGGVLQTPEREMLHAIFDLGALDVGKVMIPRPDIVAVEVDTRLDEVIALVTETNFTKFPLYDDNMDQIVGILHVKDLLRHMTRAPDWRGQTARTLGREALYVPETLAVDDLLHAFRTQRQHIAIVLDEYGGTAGLVTLEDLLEEIVGEVSDVFDEVTSKIELMPDGSALIDGLTLIEDVNAQFRLRLDEPHFHTIGGFVMSKLGRVPKVGDTVASDDVRLRVEAMDGRRVSRLLLTRADGALRGSDEANGE